MLFILVVWSLLLHTGAWGAFLGPLSLHPTKPPKVLIESEYVRPNEIYPIDAVPIFEKAPAGVHISVGTERGFIGFTLNPSATHLLLLDADPFVHRYNQMNIALLTLAKEGDLEDFRNLRWQDDHSMIVQRIQESKIQIPEFKELLSKQNWSWWREATNNKEAVLTGFAWSGYPLDSAPASKNIKDPFAGTNYLWSEKQFSKLQTAAKQGSLQSIHVNLSARRNLNKIVKALQQQKLSLSILDLSNAWWLRYISHVDGVIRAFIPITQDSSIVLLTNVEDFSHGSGRLPGRGWSYFGYTFDEIKKNKSHFRPSLRATMSKNNPEHTWRIWVPMTRTTFNGKPLRGSDPQCSLLEVLKKLLAEP